MRVLIKKFRLLALLLSLISIFFFAGSSHAAVLLSIVPPSEELVRQQEYGFNVTIDTLGESVSNLKAEVKYETQYLELVSVSNGDFFETVTHTTPSTGTIQITGTSAQAKSGSGNFAVVRFKLIATSAGSTTLCTVSPITEETPTPAGSCGKSPCDNSANSCPVGTVCVQATDGSGQSMCAMTQYQEACKLNMTSATCCNPPSCGQSPCSETMPCGSGLICVKSGSQSICAMPQYQAQCAGNMSQTSCCQAAPTAIPQAGSATGWKIGALVALSLIGVGVVGMLLL